MKSRTLKRTEALIRLKASTYENSKAKRLKKATKEQWQKKKDELLARLNQLPTGY